MGAPRQFPCWRPWLLTLAFLAASDLRLSAQTLTVSMVGDALHVKAAAFGFIEGEVLDRLKDGRSVRVDFELAATARPDGPTVLQTRHSFNLSYDLWEERFTATHIGTPEATSRSISHVTSRSAELWCLDQLTLSVRAFGRLGRDAPFWLRLGYRVLDRDRVQDSDDAPFTLRSLIDMLSRRRKAGELGDAVQAGPFRLPD